MIHTGRYYVLCPSCLDEHVNLTDVELVEDTQTGTTWVHYKCPETAKDVRTILRFGRVQNHDL